MNKHWLKCHYCQKLIKIRSEINEQIFKDHLIRHLVKCELWYSFPDVSILSKVYPDGELSFAVNLDLYVWYLNITDKHAKLAVPGRSTVVQVSNYYTAIHMLKQKIKIARITQDLKAASSG